MITTVDRVTKFLIVDDSRAIQSIIKRAIEGCSYPNLDIQSVSDAEAAIDLLQTNYRPDLIITDWHMQKVSGLEFCQHVSQMYGNQIPIGFVTTESSTEKIEHAYQSGAKFVMHKPFKDDDLRRKILELVPLGGIEKVNPVLQTSTQNQPNLVSSQQALDKMLKGQPYTLEPCPPLKIEDFSNNNLIGLFGENGNTPPVNALAIMEMNAVSMLWAINNKQLELMPALIKSGTPNNEQLNEARNFLGTFGEGASFNYKKGPLKLARASVVSRDFPRLKVSLGNNLGRVDYKLTVPGVGTGFITFIRLI